MKNDLPEINRFSHFDYLVESRSCGDRWRVEKICRSAQEAINYVHEFGKQDYRGNHHGCEMRAAVQERVHIKRLLKDNQ